MFKRCAMKTFFYVLPLLSLAFFSLSTQSAEPQPLSIVPVQIQSIAANRVFVGGKVAAHKSVVFSAQMPGRVVSISGEEGDHFDQGDLLVKINDDELLAKRQTAMAQYYSAYDAVNNANVQLYRQIKSRSMTNQTPGGMGMPGMFDQIFSNPMSEVLGIRDYSAERGADIYASRTLLSQAQYALEQALAQIQQIESHIRDTQSIAPFDGVIVSKHIEIGDTVQPGQRLLTFEDLTVLEIVVDLPGRLRQSIKQNQLISARVDGLSQDIQVRVSKIFPTSDPVRHTTRVKFTLAANNQVFPGNYAEVLIPVSGTTTTTKKHLLVPSTAVIERGGLPSIFVVNLQNQLELRLVRVGNVLPSGQIVINYGVKENERVLDRPPAFVTSGIEITQ